MPQLLLFSLIDYIVKQTHFQVRETVRAMAESSKTRELSNIDDSRIEMEPFAKNLFLGKFNTTILSYPDVLENDR